MEIPYTRMNLSMKVLVVVLLLWLLYRGRRDPPPRRVMMNVAGYDEWDSAMD